MKFKLSGMTLKAKIIKGDLVTSNGIIHVIQRMMDKPPQVVGHNMVGFEYVAYESETFHLSSSI